MASSAPPTRPPSDACSRELCAPLGRVLRRGPLSAASTRTSSPLSTCSRARSTRGPQLALRSDLLALVPRAHRHAPPRDLRALCSRVLRRGPDLRVPRRHLQRDCQWPSCPGGAGTSSWPFSTCSRARSCTKPSTRSSIRSLSTRSTCPQTRPPRSIPAPAAAAFFDEALICEFLATPSTLGLYPSQRVLHRALQHLRRSFQLRPLQRLVLSVRRGLLPRRHELTTHLHTLFSLGHTVLRQASCWVHPMVSFLPRYGTRELGWCCRFSQSCCVAPGPFPLGAASTHRSGQVPRRRRTTEAAFARLCLVRALAC